MKKLLLLLIIITTVGCNQTGVTIVEFEDEKSNAIRGHYEHYLNNDIDGLKKLWADDDKIVLYLGSVEQTPLSELIGLIGVQHAAFDNIQMLNIQGADEPIYVETKAYESGQTWTNTWFKWSAVGKTSGNLIEFPVHISFRWENGEIVEEVHLFDPTLMNQELALVPAQVKMMQIEN
ncbi:hypothetical protein OAB81_02290 [Flavobacteriaceae bacterium]|nr:hypothetical protein [Flavobacteriaceae bacterium]MDC1456702.1 hypothetical protein [Flavobacteriaceae bacterium]|tara:strand:- start:221 stop:751 length:531 start_codon:yes stop_codon:yes gene_type:complete